MPIMISMNRTFVLTVAVAMLLQATCDARPQGQETAVRRGSKTKRDSEDPEPLQAEALAIERLLEEFADPSVVRERREAPEAEKPEALGVQGLIDEFEAIGERVRRSAPNPEAVAIQRLANDVHSLSESAGRKRRSTPEQPEATLGVNGLIEEFKAIGERVRREAIPQNPVQVDVNQLFGPEGLQLRVRRATQDVPDLSQLFENALKLVPAQGVEQ